MKRGKKSQKRKRGAASRARARLEGKKFVVQALERKLNRLKELEEETRECYESVLKRYPLSREDQEELEFEWKLGLQIIADYEDATPEELSSLYIQTCESEPVSELIEEFGSPEAYWRASFELANALGLAFITIDEAGNINGERIEY
ncbi:hypothetical protein C6501_11575 [Candidatus Poribacteria bacterium]|nr:MAG: hypothetical protein C6501_11575 [Candidatus Poribacteria bacterium]